MLPLQDSSKPEMVIWTVWDGDGPGGSYPSPERAMDYIHEWMNVDEPEPQPVEVLHRHDHEVTVKCGNSRFYIRKSHYRL